MTVKTMMKHFLFATLVTAMMITVPAPSVQAADGDAGLPGSFLTYGAGARAISMGRAFAAIADDATALYWNPGGLSGVKQNQAILEYISLIDENNYQYLGYTHLIPYVGTVGVGLVMLNQGTTEGRNQFNELTENFQNNQLAVLMGFGTDITPQLAAGGTVKIVNQTMSGASGTGFGLDIGMMYHALSFLNLGLNFQNLLAPSITLKDDAETYPLNMVLGAGFNFWGGKFRADLDIWKNMEQDKVKPRIGLEGQPIRNLFIRSGFDGQEIGVGAGYRYMGFQLDYALGFETGESAGMKHKVDLSYYFGGYVLEVTPEPVNFSPVGINKVSVLRIDCQTKFQIRLWTLELFNEANASVKKYSGEGSPPKHIVWDGLQDNMNAMPDGKYKIVLTIEDASGDIRQAPDAFVTIQSIVPLGVSPVDVLSF